MAKDVRTVAATECHVLLTRVVAAVPTLRTWAVRGPRSVYAFLCQHRAIASVLAGVVVLATLGHHEWAGLFLAVNYDKVLTAMFPPGG